MKATVQRRYGAPLDVLGLEDLPDPVAGPTEVLVRVEAAGVNALDWHLTTGEPYVMRAALGLRRPRRWVPGRDVAGRVEAIGSGVTRFAPGDAVFGFSDGAFAELVCEPEGHLAHIPDGLTAIQAAAVPIAATTALQGLRVGGVQSGHRVLITGASGGVGTFAVQIAKSLGAHVTAVCSTRNLDLVRSIGADDVIDYTREDVPGSGAYEVILHIAGPTSLSAMRRALVRRGVLVLCVGGDGGWIEPLPVLLRALLLSLFVPQRLTPLVASETPEDLAGVTKMLAIGAVIPVIDRTVELAEAPAAVRYLQEGHTRGKVVVTV